MVEKRMTAEAAAAEHALYSKPASPPPTNLITFDNPGKLNADGWEWVDRNGLVLLPARAAAAASRSRLT